jgi:hypothetical protein
MQFGELGALEVSVDAEARRSEELRLEAIEARIAADSTQATGILVVRSEAPPGLGRSENGDPRHSARPSSRARATALGFSARRRRPCRARALNRTASTSPPGVKHVARRPCLDPLGSRALRRWKM